MTITFIKDAVEQAFDRINVQHSRQRNTEKVSIGYKSIDTILGGVHSGDLLVFAGFPHNYKTTLALSILSLNVFCAKRSTLIVSDSSTLHITNRLISWASNIPLEKIQRGLTSDNELEEDLDWTRLEKAIGMLTPSSLIISNKSTKDEDFLQDIEDTIKKHKFEFLFIDPFTANPKQESLDTVRALKELARQLEITIFVVIDIPEPSDKVSLPSYSHLEPFGDICSEVDALCFVYKETLVDPQGTGSKEKAETIVLSNYGRNCRFLIDENNQIASLREDEYTFAESD
jgi:replicative DNA helicase